MTMLHDANKRLIKVSDIYPEFADLKKGDYTIRLQLRHDDAALLDKMKDLPVMIERKLKEAVVVPVYASVRDALKAAKPVKERSLHAGKLFSSAYDLQIYHKFIQNYSLQVCKPMPGTY